MDHLVSILFVALCTFFTLKEVISPHTIFMYFVHCGRTYTCVSLLCFPQYACKNIIIVAPIFLILILSLSLIIAPFLVFFSFVCFNVLRHTEYNQDHLWGDKYRIRQWGKLINHCYTCQLFGQYMQILSTYLGIWGHKKGAEYSSQELTKA